MKNFEDCSKTEKVKRWEEVIRVLRGLTRHQRAKHWNMENYLEETECGTAGCAAGYSSLDPWFQKRGVKGKLVNGYWEYHGPNWDDFWGSGAEFIFQDTTPRSVGKVIREIQAHIKEIRSEE